MSTSEPPTPGTIAHEDLNIKVMARSRLAESTYDWGQFLTILHRKAGCHAGMAPCQVAVVIAVPPYKTTQACSASAPLMSPKSSHGSRWTKARPAISDGSEVSVAASSGAAIRGTPSPRFDRALAGHSLRNSAPRPVRGRIGLVVRGSLMQVAAILRR